LSELYKAEDRIVLETYFKINVNEYHIIALWSDIKTKAQCPNSQQKNIVQVS